MLPGAVLSAASRHPRLLRGLAAKQPRLSAAPTTRAMATAGGAPPPPPAGATGAAGAVDFFSLLSKLKTTKRTGWVNHGVSEPESIADHMYRMVRTPLRPVRSIMSVMAFVGAQEAGLDPGHCVQLAIAHDMAEAVVGDITPDDGVSKADKQRMEAEAMDRMHAMLGGRVSGEKIRALWWEYENGATPEAKLLKDLDKFEMILQAHEYEGAEPGKDLSDFFNSTAGKFQTPVGVAWSEEVVARRGGKGGGGAGAGEEG